MIKSPKTSYIFEKTLVFSVICCKCKNKDKKYLKRKNHLRYWKLFVYLKIYNYFKVMVEENISQWFRLKNTNEKRNDLLEEIEQNELMNRKYKKLLTTLNYI